MLRLETILGNVTDDELAAALHEMDHHGRVEHLSLSEADTQRRRLLAVTDRGTECAIAIPRSQRLSDGAVLYLRPDRAVVVRMQEQRWLELLPGNSSVALELGYFAGNMHWKVKFHGGRLRILLQGPKESYLERLAVLMADGRVVEV